MHQEQSLIHCRFDETIFHQEESVKSRWYSKLIPVLAAGLILLSVMGCSLPKAAADKKPLVSVPTSTTQGTVKSTSTPGSLGNAPVECPGLIGFGETIQCSISAAGEIDTFSFSANAGDRVLVRMSASSGSLSPGIRVQDTGSEAALCEGSGSPKAEVTGCNLPAVGTYYILADDTSGIGTGDYSLYLAMTYQIFLPVVNK
jgi:hypothetical protein